MHSKVTDCSNDLRCKLSMYQHSTLVEFTVSRKMALASYSHKIWFCSPLLNSNHENQSIPKDIIICNNLVYRQYSEISKG